MLEGYVLLRERPGQGKLRFKNGARAFDDTVQGGTQPTDHGMSNVSLDVFDSLASISLVPAAVEVLSNGAKLNDEVATKILRGYFAAFFLPKPRQFERIIAHDDAGVRAANEAPAIGKIWCSNLACRHWDLANKL